MKSITSIKAMILRESFGPCLLATITIMNKAFGRLWIHLFIAL